ncbi:MAG: transglycosylase family protein [Actinomycetia bacterium]|nr:transglycosylase family protein [Actinomycetes bacterium]
MGEYAESADQPARAPLPPWWWNQTLRVRRLIALGVLCSLVIVLAVVFMSILGGEQGARAFVASLPDERVALWDDLAACESESDWSLDTGNGYFGGLQITPESWGEAGGDGLPHQASRHEQIMRAERIQESKGWGAWPRCSATLSLGQ